MLFHTALSDMSWLSGFPFQLCTCHGLGLTHIVFPMDVIQNTLVVMLCCGKISKHCSNLLLSLEMPISLKKKTKKKKGKQEKNSKKKKNLIDPTVGKFTKSFWHSFVTGQLNNIYIALSMEYIQNDWH